jgi:hypothetical protein
MTNYMITGAVVVNVLVHFPYVDADGDEWIGKRHKFVERNVSEIIEAKNEDDALTKLVDSIAKDEGGIVDVDHEVTLDQLSAGKATIFQGDVREYTQELAMRAAGHREFWEL